MCDTQEDRLRFISKTHRQLFADRRQYEWKVLTATLTLFALSVAAVYAKHLRIPNSALAIVVVWFMCIGLACASSIYLYHLHQAHRLNKRFAERAERAIIEKTGDAELLRILNDPATTLKSSEGSDWSLRWQIVVVVLFAVVTALLLTVAPSLSTDV